MRSNSDLLKTLSVLQRKLSESASADSLADWLTIITDEFNLTATELCESNNNGHFTRSAAAGRALRLPDEILSQVERLRCQVAKSKTAEVIEIHLPDDSETFWFACFPIPISGKTACLGVTSSVKIDSDLQTALLIAAGELTVCLERPSRSNGNQIHSLEDSEHAFRELTAKLTDRVEAERRRLSRELHDQAGQSLTAILIRLDLVSEKITDVGIRQQLQQIESLAEDTINEIRRISRDLRPAVLDDLGLEEALEGLASTLSGGALSINLIIDKPFPRMPEGIETALYRIAQEALNNVIKHAGATVAAIRLQYDTDQVQLEIKDNGCGIDFENKNNVDQGIGLLGMKERADSHGGKLFVESQPGSGTRVRVEIPL